MNITYFLKQKNLRKQKIEKPVQTKFSVNDKVEHTMFGKGIVKSVKTMTGYQVLNIKFEKAGMKTIATGHACLIKI